MYGAMFNEGHDARLFRFSPAADGSIKGSHKSPPNVELWQVGCLGLSTPCSQVLRIIYYEARAERSS